MTPESYQVIKNILMNSAGLIGQEKQDFIDHSCQSHPELATYIREILNDESENAELLEQSVEFHYDTASEESLAEIDTQITDYTLIKKIGSGGMGDVYQADQTSPVERQVALKVLKNIPNQQLLMSEMQILAQLNHPNIATLFDVGRTSDKRLFLVMELIAGEDIVSWCDNNKYNQIQKIQLFQQLCAGISFAHEKGIIHCDIKPSNVQITQVNNQAIVKIIDFGISQLFKKSSQTNYESLSGTPVYLSPEVLNANGKTLADTRRDVYALGVLLYRLIVGKLPDNEVKNQKFTNDLMVIINKAMSVEVIHRYANANDLSLDLTRFLNKQPVVAKKSSWTYVLTRFVQRRFGVVVFSLVLLMTLIGGFIAQGIQANRADNQAKIAIQQSIKAKAAQNEAEELTGFLMGLFDLSNPERVNQQQVTTQDLINKAHTELLSISKPSLSDARFMSTIGSIYLRMDELDKAQISIEKSLVTKQLLLDKNHTEIIADITQLGVINRKLGNNNQAEKSLQQALALINTQQTPELSQKAYIHNHLGNLYWQTKRTDHSISNHKQALSIRTKLADEKEMADSYNNLGAIYLQNKQWDLSQLHLEKALVLYQKVYGESHPFIAYTQQNLGIVAEGQKKLIKAQELYLISLESLIKIYGKNHNKTLYSQKNLAIFYAKNEQYDQSIKLRKATIAGYKQIGNDAQKIIRSRYLAKIYADAGDFDSSVKQYQQTLEWLKQTPSKDKMLVPRMHIKMAKSNIKLKNYDEAMNSLNKIYEKLKSTNNLNHYFNQMRLNTLGEIYTLQNKFNQAKSIYHQVINLSEVNVRDNQEEVILAYLGLAQIQMKLQNYEQANTQQKKALEITEKNYDEYHRVMLIVYKQMALLAQLTNQKILAKSYLQKILIARSKSLPEQHSELINLQKELEALDI
jgi:serine/threonine-protein kinase